jgi:hypothetical protein
MRSAESASVTRSLFNSLKHVSDPTVCEEGSWTVGSVWVSQALFRSLQPVSKLVVRGLDLWSAESALVSQMVLYIRYVHIKAYGSKISDAIR